MSNRSSFPEEIDQFIEHFEISPSDVGDVARFQELLLKSNRSSSEDDELDQLKNSLRDKLILAEDFNYFQDALMNMQVFIRDEVEGYIDQKQNEFNTFVANAENRLDESIDAFDYINVYSSSTEYVKRNLVKYNDGTGDKIYMAIQNTIGNDPQNTNYWIQLTIKGDKGDSGEDGVGLKFVGQWESSKVYEKDDAVQYGGIMFGSMIDNNVGNEPSISENTPEWEVAFDVGIIVNVLRGQRTIGSDSSTVNFMTGEINVFNKNIDDLQVYANSVALEEGIDYVIENDEQIAKTSGSWDSGTIFFFRVMRNQAENLVFTDGNSISEGTINQTKLSNGLSEKINDIDEKLDDQHLSESEPHKYGGRFSFKYNSSSDTLDLVVYEE